jgi:Protein of unknown function (DUF4231)
MGTEETLTEAAVDERVAGRIARAKRYLGEDLKDQRGWYSRKASRFKLWSQLLAVTVLAAGGLTTVVQIVPGGLWVKLVTCLLGLIVVLAKGAERIWNFEATWQGYRKASERIKREYRLYINGAGAYREVADEEEAYLRFVEAIEEIIAEEQQLYWQSRAGGGRPEGGAAEGGAPGGADQAGGSRTVSGLP